MISRGLGSLTSKQLTGWTRGRETKGRESASRNQVAQGLTGVDQRGWKDRVGFVSPTQISSGAFAFPFLLSHISNYMLSVWFSY